MEAEKIVKKLQLHKAKNPLIVNAPEVFATVVSGIEYDVQPSSDKEGGYDFVQIFAVTQAELEKLAKQVEKAGKYDCIFWACYPKTTGKIKSDIKRETVWIAFEQIGLQAVSAVAIDDTWSALRARPVDKVGR